VGPNNAHFAQFYANRALDYAQTAASGTLNSCNFQCTATKKCAILYEHSPPVCEVPSEHFAPFCEMLSEHFARGLPPVKVPLGRTRSLQNSSPPIPGIVFSRHGWDSRMRISAWKEREYGIERLSVYCTSRVIKYFAK
jgi:hypothetical protein